VKRTALWSHRAPASTRWKPRKISLDVLQQIPGGARVKSLAHFRRRMLRRRCGTETWRNDVAAWRAIARSGAIARIAVVSPISKARMPGAMPSLSQQGVSHGHIPVVDGVGILVEMRIVSWSEATVNGNFPEGLDLPKTQGARRRAHLSMPDRNVCSTAADLRQPYGPNKRPIRSTRTIVLGFAADTAFGSARLAFRQGRDCPINPACPFIVFRALAPSSASTNVAASTS